MQNPAPPKLRNPFVATRFVRFPEFVCVPIVIVGLPLPSEAAQASPVPPFIVRLFSMVNVEEPDMYAQLPLFARIMLLKVRLLPENANVVPPAPCPTVKVPLLWVKLPFSASVMLAYDNSYSMLQ